MGSVSYTAPYFHVCTVKEMNGICQLHSTIFSHVNSKGDEWDLSVTQHHIFMCEQ